jgi:ATP-binding cassette, subfamily B, bacterial PglK
MVSMKALLLRTEFLLRLRKSNSYLLDTFKLLAKADKLKISLISLSQALLSFLDLIGVILIGGLGALSVQGIETRAPGTKVKFLLRTLHIDNFIFQKQVAILGIASAILLISKTLMSVYLTRETFYYLSNKGADISINLISRVLSLDLLELQSRTSQEMQYMVSEGIRNLMVGGLATAVNLIADFSLLIVILSGLFAVDLTIALLTIIVFSTVGIFLYRNLSVRARYIGKQEYELSVKNNEKILEILDSYRELTVRNRRAFYSKVLSKIRKKLGQYNAEMNFQPYISKYILELTSIIAALLLASYEFSTKNATYAISILVIFFAASSRVAPAALRIQQGLLVIKNSEGSAEETLKLLKELQYRNETVELPFDTSMEYKGFIPKIELKMVNFKYKGSRNFAVSKINLNVEPGMKVAIVGPTGSGKSTLADLILGIIQPNSGEILISNQEPKAVCTKWSGAIAYVPQNVVLTSGTIRENICQGFPIEQFSDLQIWQALKVAMIDEFVLSLPNTINAHLGERGTKLSGGQRQRLGIARALITKPKLLVLDEATSALDGKTEMELGISLESLANEITIVVIAHRLSTVKNSDLVIYLESGKIRYSGSFAEVRANVPDFDSQAKLLGI